MTKTHQAQTQETQELEERVEKVFYKLLGGRELDEEELALFKNERFRKLLAQELTWYPHVMRAFI